MAKLLQLSLSLCFLLFTTCFALRDQPQQNECQLDKLQSLKPDHRIKSEAGQIETWNPNNKQFRCAGVALSRCTLERNGLRLPSYSNSPQLIYIEQGNGVFGIVFPGCAETFEEPQQSQSQSRRSSQSQDRHQKIRHFRAGDVIAVPAGLTSWLYNNGDDQVVAVSLLDTSSYHNQLDQLPRRFYLAGNQEQEFLQYQKQQGRRQGQQQQSRRQGQQQQEEEPEGKNVYSGFEEEFLAEAFNVDKETARKIQGQDDKREGGIVRVKGGLSILGPPSRQQQQGRGQQQEEGEEEEEEEEKQEQQQGRQQEKQQERRQQEKGRQQEKQQEKQQEGRQQEKQQEKQQERRQQGRRGSQSQSQSQSESESESDNGLEETVCTMRLRQNIGKSTSPDIYNPQAGSIRTVNSLDLPVLRWLRLSAEYGSLHRNAMFVPHYNLNANSIIYALRGRATVQVVDCSGNSVYNQELEAGQVLIVPQNFAVAARAQTEKFEYVTFKTNDNAMIATLAGRTSVISALPEEVVAQSYQLRREQARQLKNNNKNSFLVAPRQESEMRAVA